MGRMDNWVACSSNCKIPGLFMVINWKGNLYRKNSKKRCDLSITV